MSSPDENIQQPLKPAEFQDRIKILEQHTIDLESQIKMLQEHRDMLQLMLQDSPEPFICYDTQYRVLFLNYAFTKTSAGLSMR